MTENGTRKVFLSIAAVVLIGALGGLGAAVAFKKVPNWLKRDRLDSGASTLPDPLFYSKIGDSPAPDPENTASEKPLEEKFTIEIAKLSSRDQAELLIKDLAKIGLDAYYTPLLKDGRVIYRVRYGIFDSESGAKSASKSVQAKLRGAPSAALPPAVKIRVSSM
jgi:hypothetical protein